MQTNFGKIVKKANCPLFTAIMKCAWSDLFCPAQLQMCARMLGIVICCLFARTCVNMYAKVVHFTAMNTRMKVCALAIVVFVICARRHGHVCKSCAVALIFCSPTMSNQWLHTHGHH